VKASGHVEAAGGYIVQLMPGIKDSYAAAIEDAIRSLPHPTTMLRSGDTPESILTRIFADGLEILEAKPVRFYCPCSKERAERALLLLGADTIREIIAADREKGATEVICQFCAADYHLSILELETLLNSLN
jgi:molecular chaperone Hsp33